jgi:hypothetical protein
MCKSLKLGWSRSAHQALSAVPIYDERVRATPSKLIEPSRTASVDANVTTSSGIASSSAKINSRLPRFPVRTSRHMMHVLEHLRRPSIRKHPVC